MDLIKIDFENKAKPKEVSIEYYWFENKSIGLAKTLFHRIIIPLEPFDSGLEHVQQPENTEIIIEWINLGLNDPSMLPDIEISSKKTKDVEASVYIGSAHNVIDIEELKLTKIGDDRYELKGVLYINFEDEGVAQNEKFHLHAFAKFTGLAT